MDVRDNQVTVELLGKQIVLEASNGACKAYADAFVGNIAKPFVGNLMNDILVLYKEVEDNPDEDITAGFIDIPFEALFRMVWALGRASGSIKSSWAKYAKDLEHESISYYDLAGLYYAVVHELGDGHFFRIPKGLRDALKSDQEQTSGEDSIRDAGGSTDVAR